MKKIYTTIAMMLLAFIGVNAETNTENISDAGTDQALLESTNALMITTKKTQNSISIEKTMAPSLKVWGYAQGGYTATMPEHGDNSNSFDMKRAVLMASAQITPKFYAFFMHEFKSGAMQEYYLEYRPCKAFNVRMGQSKIEFSMENPMSPTVLESISPMSQSVGWLCGRNDLMGNPSGRDLGLTAYGDVFNNKLRYVLQVVNGASINNSDKDNKKNVIAKLEYKPIPNIRLSVSGQKGYGTAVASSKYGAGINEGEIYKQDRYGFGVEYKSKAAGSDYYKNRCASVRAEVLGGKDGKCESLGAYISTAIPVYKQLDVIGMVDYMDYNTSAKIRNTEFVAGVQYWYGKKCRLQAQYAYSMPNDAMKLISGDNKSTIRTQLQVAF